MPVLNLLIVDNPSRWDFTTDQVEVVSAKSYLSDERYQRFSSGARVFNLCRSYSYQSLGYYVSLLAEARGHRAIPDVATLRDFRSSAVVRMRGMEWEEEIQLALRKVETDEITLRLVFGQSLTPGYSSLGQRLFRLFPSPLLKVQFGRRKNVWTITGVAPLSLQSFSEEERLVVKERVGFYFSKRQNTTKQKKKFLYDLAVVIDPTEISPPSDSKALERFATAAREIGFCTETITTDDIDRIKEFDAVFIRQTTAVDRPIYQLSRLAYAEGLAVIDDPWSILKSTNKIYMAESLARARIPAPKTWILTKEDLKINCTQKVTYPCVLKIPDGAFSVGVRKVENREEFVTTLKSMLDRSELILAQAFVPSEYDWRVGILDNQPLFACRYFMAKDHWQIYNWAAESEDLQSGGAETLHVDDLPPQVLETAQRAARLVGDGLYGIDLKQVGKEVMVIEVNDNPSIEAGIEDKMLGMELYFRIARSFRRRVEALRSGL